MTNSHASRIGVDGRRVSRRGAAIAISVAAIAGLAGCGGTAAGTVPADTDHGVLASSPAAIGSDVAPTGEGTPTAGASSQGAPATAGGSAADVYVTGRTNLGGRASAEFVAKIRGAVQDYVSSHLPGTTVTEVRVTTEQARFASAVVALAASGGPRTVVMTLTEQPTGWIVAAVTPFPGGIR